MTVLLDNLRVRRLEWTAAALPIVELKKQAWCPPGTKKAGEEMYDSQKNQHEPVGPWAGQGAMGAALPAPVAPTPAAIPSHLDEQQGALSQLHKTISELEDHLAPVLSHDARVAENNRIEPPESPQFVHRLGRHNREIHLAIQRLYALHARLHF